MHPDSRGYYLYVLQLQRTPLHRAATQNNTEVIAILVEHGPQAVTMKDKDGMTPLNIALFGPVITSLIEAGSDINDHNNVIMHLIVALILL